MRRSPGTCLVGAAVVITLTAWPTTAAASDSTARTTGTNTYFCLNADRTDVVPIDDAYTRTQANGHVHEVDVLTNTVTGTSMRFVSNYRLVYDQGVYSLKGPSILDLFEPAPEIYYDTGHVVIALSEGGYPAGTSADEVTDVCALLMG